MRTVGDAGFEGVGGADEGVGGNEGAEGSAAVARRRSRTRLGLVLGIVWVVLPLVLFLLDRPILLSGNPAHVIALAACGLVGVVLLVNETPDDRRRHRRRPRWARVLGQVVGVIATVTVLGVLVWLRPFAATPSAVASLEGGADVRVTDAPAQITIAPKGSTPTRGLVFQPGARVDPRAYVPMLSQVSKQGVLVVIVKQPFDIGLLATTAPQSLVDEHPEVVAWAVGGHSLGGVAAARFALDHRRLVRGLVLWASYPDQSLAGRTDLQVASVSGTRDAFTTPADVAASRAMLPRTTAYTRVEGAVHSFFGDYGSQPGDGSPTVSRAQAQRQVVDATVRLMLSL
ncbi:MAG: alpha/beta hydrolase [Dermatophilaceae bacterium]|nr:alpha/beta hydrolase [Dermatophilaceae bacterium]NUR80360.1 alpha/beta hydrolase [Dermatophilaceae bacterium]